MKDNSSHDWDDASVGEYALGVMPQAERIRFAAELINDAVLRRRLAAWEERLAPLADDIAPVAPPDALFARIEEQLGHGAPKQAARPFGWRWLPGGGLIGGLIAALGVLALIALQPGSAQLPQAGLLEATLASADGGLALSVRYDPAKGAITLARSKGGTATARDQELWLIAGGDAPVSLGVLPDNADAVIAVPTALQARMAGATLAISDEPDGGSPTGQPTGAVLAAAVIEST
jgi:anti-sigma-K factor RskA